MSRAWRYRAMRLAFRVFGWVERRFTPAGRLALASLGISGALGFDTTQSMAYQGFAFLAAALGVSMLASLSFRARFEARRSLPRFGTAGEPMPYRMTVRNHSGRPWDGMSVVEDVARAWPTREEFDAVGAESLEGLSLLERLSGLGRWEKARQAKLMAAPREAPLPAVAAGGEAELDLTLEPRRRGRLRLGGAIVSRPDPLGLFRGLRRAAAEDSVLILPRRYRLPRLALPGSRRHQPGGVALASSVGDSQEFKSLRDYRPGDPLRRIHWRSWAKTGSPIVREHEDEYFVRHALALDTFASDASPAFEEAVSVAASFACAVLTQESLLDLLFVGAQSYCFTAGRGVGGPERMLEVLAGVEPCRDKGLESLELAVARRHRSLSGCVLVLLGFDAPRRAFIRRLEALGVPTLAMAVVDPSVPPFEDPRGVRRLETGRIQEGLARL